MKKFHKITIFLLFAVGASGATYAGRPNYLNSAGGAWTSMLGQSGRGGDIATFIQDAQTNNTPAFLNMIDVIAYNDTAMNLYTITGHINDAMNFLAFPDMGRRPSGKTLAISAGGIANFDNYDSDYNSDFETHTFGAFVRAIGYVGDGFSLGVGYTNEHGETRHTKIDNTTESNSVTIFTQYMAPNGIFLNMGINGGATRWKIDKTIASIPDDSTYNSDFYAGQVSTGIQMTRGTFALTPHIGARYTRITADRHSDAAAQTFDKWWYNTLNANAGIAAQFAFLAGGAIITPHMHVGGAYDAISNGTDNMDVTLIGGQKYIIPIDAPHRAAFVGSLGVNIHANQFVIDAKYTLDVRSNYTSHGAILGAKFTF